MVQGGPGKPRMIVPKNKTRLFAVYYVVSRFPGVTLTKLAVLMNTPRNILQGALCSMDSVGLLLSEDGKGSLYPFCITSPKEAKTLWEQIRT